MARVSSAEICKSQSLRAMCASSWERTMRRRSSGQSVASEGSTMTGRKIPHVRGMARELPHWRRRTERASLWNWESLKTVRIQSSSKMGFDEDRSEEHTSELQSRFDLVCRLLLEKKK